MRKLPFIIIGIVILLAITSMVTFQGCESTENREQKEAIRDTLYITEEYDLDEDFYSMYHPDSVDITIPDGFAYYTDYEVRKYGRFRSQLAYALGIMLPKASYPHSSQIARWVINRVADDEAFRGAIEKKSAKPHYNGNLFSGVDIFDYMADQFFDYMIGTYTEGEDFTDLIAYHDGITMTVAFLSSRFITYREDTDCYWSGAHGMYTEKYLTLDLTSGKELRNNDIFRKEYIDSVQSQFVKVASLDSAYLEVHNHKPGDDISYVFKDDNGNFNLPQGALLENGVVFSFQPYEISGFAQGCFHFIVPYSDLMPYLTNHAKSLIQL